MTHETFIWQGRVDSTESGDTTRLHQIARPLAASEVDIALTDKAVLLGFCCDEGVRRNQGRVGAKQAPEYVRKALASLPAHGLQVLYDAGDVRCDDQALEQAQQRLAERIAGLLDVSPRLAVIGGGHEIAYASYLGLARHLDASRREGRTLILNLDAHFDLRTSRPGSSGTPFDQIFEHAGEHGRQIHYCCLGISPLSNTPALYARARQLGASYLEDAQMREGQLAQVREFVQAQLAQAEHVYLTIDLDVLPAAQAPGVSAPAAYGVELAVVEDILLTVKQSGKLRLLDMAELNPEFDRDGLTAKTAARLLWRYFQ